MKATISCKDKTKIFKYVPSAKKTLYKKNLNMHIPYSKN